jgi:predicted RNA-binding protein with RPS1 domain
VADVVFFFLTGAWVKIGTNMSVPLAFVPATHVASSFVRNLEDFINVGQVVTIYVLSVDAKANKLSASLLSNPLMRRFKEQPRVSLEELMVRSRLLLPSLQV